MPKANDLTIDVKARLAIDRRTAETCLRLVETYCNANGLIITGNRDDGGEIAFEFEAMAENFQQISPDTFAAINALGRRTHKVAAVQRTHMSAIVNDLIVEYVKNHQVDIDRYNAFFGEE